MASESAQKPERRLKFSSVRRLERQDPSVQRPNTTADNATADIVRSTHGGPLAAVGGILTTGYVAVARRILLGFEAVQDARAARRAAALRGSARAKALPSP
jgi:hypothetical protein